MDIRLPYAPLLFGVFLNLILYGVLLMQAFHYHLTYPKDDKWIKCFVLYLLIVETVNTGSNMSIIYQPFIARFGSPDVSEFLPTMFPAEPITTVLISTPIQLFLARRVWLFTKSKILTSIIVAFSLASLTGGVWTLALVVPVHTYNQMVRLHLSALFWLLGACIADVLITVVLVFTLHRKKTGFVATDDVIAKIIRSTVQTGLLTALAALGDVLCFMTQTTTLNFFFEIPLCKLYTNCLLSTLNARATLWNSSQSHSYSHSPMPNRSGGLSMEVMSPTKGKHDSKLLDPCPDVEYGITITKVMEISADDSGPMNHTQ